MEIMNINGIEYVRKDELIELKKQVAKSLGEINLLIDEPAPVKRGVRPADNEIYKPSKVARKKINIKSLDTDGRFILKNNRKTRITMKDVLFIKANCRENATYKEVREIGKKMGLRTREVGRIIYNLDKGVFDDVINNNEFYKLCSSDYIPPKKEVKVQNNIEKRKDGW